MGRGMKLVRGGLMCRLLRMGMGRRHFGGHGVGHGSGGIDGGRGGVMMLKREGGRVKGWCGMLQRMDCRLACWVGVSGSAMTLRG